MFTSSRCFSLCLPENLKGTNTQGKFPRRFKKYQNSVDPIMVPLPLQVLTMNIF